MHPSFDQIDHRPWPLPESPWIMRNSWCDLLFAHWPVPVEAVRPLVPESLEIDTFGGQTWVAVVPFYMKGVTPRHLPDVPGMSAFPELNVRVYVKAEDKAGVYFLTLDATNPVAVWAAQTFFKLPYYWANIDIVLDGDGFRYESRRKKDGVRFKGSYRPTGPEFLATPGSLEHWLTERYCLYTEKRGILYRGEIHHWPWPVQPAEAVFETNELGNEFGLPMLNEQPAHFLFAKRIEVALWGLDKVAG